MAGVTDVWGDPREIQPTPMAAAGQRGNWLEEALKELYRGSAADLGLGPGGMGLATPMMTHAGRNLIPFSHAFRTALEVLAEAKGVAASELPKLDVAKVYMGLRYPKFSRMFGVGEAVGRQMPEGYRAKAEMFDVLPSGALQEARDPRAALNVNASVADTINNLYHEGGHFRQRVRSLRGLTKDIRPEDLVTEGLTDPVTGKPGRYVHFETDPVRYFAQPVEKYAMQAGGTAETGAKNLVERLLKQRELMQQAGQDTGKATTTSAGEQLLRLLGYF